MNLAVYTVDRKSLEMTDLNGFGYQVQSELLRPAVERVPRPLDSHGQPLAAVRRRGRGARAAREVE